MAREKDSSGAIRAAHRRPTVCGNLDANERDSPHREIYFSATVS